jgi:hypothetical protein
VIGIFFANAGALYEVDSEGPRVEVWNWVLGEFRQIRKSRKFRKSAISGEFDDALLDVQRLDGSTLYEPELFSVARASSRRFHEFKTQGSG